MSIEKNLEKLHQRTKNVDSLIDDFNLLKDANYFADPEHRLELIKGLSTEEFIDLAYHVNARMRNQDPRDRENRLDVGASLPLLGTPEPSEKANAFQAGYDVIREYLLNSNDTVGHKLSGVGMAIEALVIWVHLFNDGNGRTARFLGKFIEDGTVLIDDLRAETTSQESRLRDYGNGLRVDEYNLVKNQDILWDEGELEEIKAKTEMPVGLGIELSIKRLLYDDKYRQIVHQQQAEYKKRALANPIK